MSDIEAQFADFLKDPETKERLLNGAKEALEEKMLQQFKWSLPDHISGACNEFIKDEIAPEIRLHLAGQKGAILKASKEAADMVCLKMKERMIEKAEENIEANYKFSDVMKKIFD